MRTLISGFSGHEQPRLMAVTALFVPGERGRGAAILEPHVLRHYFDLVLRYIRNLLILLMFNTSYNSKMLLRCGGGFGALNESIHRQPKSHMRVKGARAILDQHCRSDRR